jgi:hypothetical protein
MMRVSLSTSSFKIVRRFLAVAVLLFALIFISLRYIHLTDGDHGVSLYDFNHYVTADTIDVLCVGSSHIYCAINPVQLYDDCGIAAYDMAGGSQAVWFSYYYLKEALKTQSPKLVILDVYTIYKDDDLFTEKIPMNLLEMRPSANKAEALKAAGTDDFWGEFLIAPVYHSRYANINRDCYDNNDYCLLGCSLNWSCIPYTETEDLKSVSEITPVSEKAETYLRKAIELCQKNNIDILLTNTPTPCTTADQQTYYNYVAAIAAEYGVTFLNGSLLSDEIGMDFTTECFDSGHLNYYGIEKYTAWLERYLQDHYDLPDRRGEEGYKHWEEASVRYRELLKRQERLSEENAAVYLRSLADDAECVNFLFSNGDKNSLSSEVCEALNEVGIELNEPGIVVFQGDTIIYQGNLKDSYEYVTYLDKYIFSAEGSETDQTLYVDRETVGTVSTDGDPELYIFTYNATIGAGYSYGKEL